MTAERKKAVMYLSLAFITGILIGALVPGFFGRFRDRSGQFHEGPQGGLVHILYRVFKPDSIQSAKIRPIIEQTSDHIDVLQNGCNQEVKSVMDSLRLGLQPLLTADQLGQLDNFLSKGKEHWKRR